MYLTFLILKKKKRGLSGPPHWRLDARLTTLLCKNIIAKSKKVKTGCKMTESSKEGCGSKKRFANVDDEKEANEITFLSVKIYTAEMILSSLPL
jgi:hypothetical protein